MINIFNDSERFQEGMFTAFYCLKSVGLSKEKISAILNTLEENNEFKSDDYKNLNNNFNKFCDEYDKSYKNLKEMK